MDLKNNEEVFPDLPSLEDLAQELPELDLDSFQPLERPAVDAAEDHRQPDHGITPLEITSPEGNA